MAYTSNLFAIWLTSLLLISTGVQGRKVLESKSTLLAGFKLDEEGSSSCWDALLELQSCSAEIVMFFINGEMHIGPGCCGAIRIIEHQCWPSMLGSLGITAEEGDVLCGYCDASADLGLDSGSGGKVANVTAYQSLPLPP